nr:hypothetical protein Q903MT_gene6268 [Picea sitchensis]
MQVLLRDHLLVPLQPRLQVLKLPFCLCGWLGTSRPSQHKYHVNTLGL